MISSSKVLAAKDQPADVALLERMLKGGGCTNVSSTTNPTRVYGLRPG